MRPLALALLIAMCVACAHGQEAPPAEDEAELLVARALWPEQDLSKTAYHVFGDPALRELVDIFPATEANGAALLALHPGTYWIQAVVDVNGNGVPDTGDGLGWYGVDELSGEARPQPLQVAGLRLEPVVVPILVTIAEGGGLSALPWAQARRPAIIAGTVTGGEGDTIVTLLPMDEGGRPIVRRLGEDGSFALKAMPGRWRLLIVAERSGDGVLGAGDLIATRGFDDEPLLVEPGVNQTLGEIALPAGVAAPPGLPAIVGGRITGAIIPEGATGRVAFCPDASLRRISFSVDTDAQGSFLTVVPPATYYVRATIDIGSDGGVGPGDMLGFYGVAELLSEDRPQTLELPPGALRTNLVIAITARLDETGRLIAYSAETNADTNAPGDAPGE